MTPRRHQRSRQKGSKLPAGVVCVDRATKWGNPHKLPVGISVPRARLKRIIAEYQYDLLRGALPITVADVRAELRGKDLACWCPLDRPCHADVLLRIANEDP